MIAGQESSAMSINSHGLSLPDGAKLVASESAVLSAIDSIADRINARFGDSQIILLILMKGGLHFASVLSQRLKMPLHIDYVQVSRYRNDTRGGELHWIYQPEVDFHGKTVLIVDDIFDEGWTLNAVVEWLNERKATCVLSAVLVNKAHQRKCPTARADFIGLTLPDTFLIGYGMDYQGLYRNIPSIYSCKL